MALPILTHAIHDAELDDIALKHSAAHTITLIVQYAATQPPGAPHHVLLERTLMPALRRGLRLPIERDALRQSVERGEVVPLMSLITRIQNEYRGEIIEVELEYDDGALIYEIDLLTPAGNKIEFEFDVGAM